MMKQKPTVIRLIISLFGFFLVSLHANAQTTISAAVSAGYAFNVQSFYLGEEKMKNVNGAIFRAGALVDFPLGSVLLLQTGAQGSYHSVSGEIGYSRYRARGFKFYVPFLLGYKANERVAVFGGMAIRNAKDLSHFHIAGSHNIRYDAVLLATYTLQPGWKLTASYNHDIGIPAAYLLNDPQSSFSVGMLYRIAWSRKKHGVAGENLSHNFSSYSPYLL